LGFGFFLAASLMGGHGHGHTGHIHVHIHAPGVHHAPVGGHGAQHSATHTPNVHSSADSANNQQNTQQANFSLTGYLNPTSIAIFLLGFGFFGYFFHNLTPVAASLSLLLAIIGGIVLAAVLLSLLSRIFANVESSTEQIIYTSPAGMRKSIPARGLNNQHLDRDLEVVVVNYQHGVAEVDTWEHFMHEEADLSDPAMPDGLSQLHIVLNQSDSGDMEMLMRQKQQME
jgi:hypothetical protein